jgi:hypothetical protein
MALAILFYVGLGAVVAYLIWGCNQQKKSQTTQKLSVEPSRETSSRTHKRGNQALVIGGVIGLLVVLGMAWAGGKYGSGNSMVSSSGGAVTSQPVTSHLENPAPVWVNSYRREDGTNIPGHWRSAADGDPSNNWSNKPNVNPYTGKPGTHAPKKK